MSITFLSCAQNKKTNTEKSNDIIEVISVEEFEKITGTIQLVDVRTPEEYNEGFIKNAENINVFDKDFLNQMSNLDKNEPIYVYCKSGKRSGKAANQLKEAGFSKIYNLEGGIMNWIAEEKEIYKAE